MVSFSELQRKTLMLFIREKVKISLAVSHEPIFTKKAEVSKKKKKKKFSFNNSFNVNQNFFEPVAHLLKLTYSIDLVVF